MAQTSGSEQVSIEILRDLARDAFAKHMNATASSLAEEIIRLTGCTFEDELFYASCLFYGQEYRRCLALLEHKSMLSAEILFLVSELLLRGSTMNSKNDNDGYLVIPTSTSVSSSSSSSSISVNSALSAVLLAAQCLLSLEQYDDCLLLLESVIVTTADEGSAVRKEAISNAHNLKLMIISGKANTSSSRVNPMAGIYNTAGRCYDQLDNLECARKCYSLAVSIDPICIEAIDTLVSNSYLSPQQRLQLFHSIDFTMRPWIKAYYHSLLLSLSELESDTPTTASSSTSSQSLAAANNSRAAAASIPVVDTPETAIIIQQQQQQQQQQVYGTTTLIGLTTHPHSSSGTTLDNNSSSTTASSLIRASEHLLNHSQQTNEAYRLARAAYVQDPFYQHGIMTYIACLVELNLTAELFYLGHELTQLHPKRAMSWYAVGCYYYCCRKYEAAQKHFHKCNKIDKRFVAGYIMSGRALSQQEEREHAVSAYRTACRLLPGDHRPVVCMAKELMKTNCISLALHLLSAALESAPRCAVTLNELGVAYLRLDREEDAVEALAHSVHCLHHYHHVSGSYNNSIDNTSSRNKERRTAGAEIYCNYGTALRRMGHYERALQWYALSLAEEPHDHDTHAAIGYTYHLLRRFDAAITSYHRALALHPSSAFCAEMLSRALIDTCLYNNKDEDDDEDKEDQQQQQQQKKNERNGNNNINSSCYKMNSAVQLSFSDQ